MKQRVAGDEPHHRQEREEGPSPEHHEAEVGAADAEHRAVDVRAQRQVGRPHDVALADAVVVERVRLEERAWPDLQLGQVPKGPARGVSHRDEVRHRLVHAVGEAHALAHVVEDDAQERVAIRLAHSYPVGGDDHEAALVRQRGHEAVGLGSLAEEAVAELKQASRLPARGALGHAARHMHGKRHLRHAVVDHLSVSVAVEERHGRVLLEEQRHLDADVDAQRGVLVGLLLYVEHAERRLAAVEVAHRALAHGQHVAHRILP